MVTVRPQIMMAAKPAIKRVHNKLVCFVEREQARPQVNIFKLFFLIVILIIRDKDKDLI